MHAAPRIFSILLQPHLGEVILSAMVIMTMTRKIERIDLTLKNGAGSSYQKAFSKTSRDGHLISSRLNGTYLAGGVGGKVEEGRRLKFLGWSEARYNSPASPAVNLLAKTLRTDGKQERVSECTFIFTFLIIWRWSGKRAKVIQNRSCLASPACHRILEWRD